MSAFSNFFDNLAESIERKADARQLKKYQRAFSAETPSTGALNKELGYALKMNLYGAAAYLLEQGANPDSTGDYPRAGYSTSHDERHLFRMVESGNLTSMALLIKAGANVDIASASATSDCLTRTPLHMAVLRNNRQAVAALLAAGADLDIQDSSQNGNTALRYARELCYDDIAKMITDEDARRNAPVAAPAPQAMPQSASIATNAVLAVPSAVRPKIREHKRP